ncbi:MAG: polysaccharide biosynthesis/export family protein [Bacteroidales bacterium]|nr:polysaccharide biosynthesis/export family protein [Bacteroidales bacterium]
MKNLSSLFSKLAIFVLLSMLISGCASRKKVLMLQDISEQSTSINNPGKASYHLQKGDNLYIKVYSVDEKTSKFFQSDFPNLMNPTYLFLNSYTIDEKGYINVSFIDKLKVEGLTVEEAKNNIQKALNEYFKECTVTVKLVNFQVSVLGEVNKPGTFTIDKEQINLFQALGLAGGPKDFSNLKKVILVRQTDAGSKAQVLDITNLAVLESEYFYLMPNDIIYVEPVKAKMAIYGSNTPYIVFSSITSALLLLSILL